MDATKEGKDSILAGKPPRFAFLDATKEGKDSILAGKAERIAGKPSGFAFLDARKEGKDSILAGKSAAREARQHGRAGPLCANAVIIGSTFRNAARKAAS